jgi:hypothetical protein
LLLPKNTGPSESRRSAAAQTSASSSVITPAFGISRRYASMAEDQKSARPISDRTCGKDSYVIVELKQ